MSTMDFNFSFKNAIQLRCYNQFKTQEKKLKKDAERILAEITVKLEKEALESSADSLANVDKEQFQITAVFRFFNFIFWSLFSWF